MSEALSTTPHRGEDEPQPEFCDLCGLDVGGSRLLVADVEGLRGYAICDVTPGCARLRSALSHQDHKRFFSPPANRIGQSRVFPAGAELGTEDE